MAKPPTQLAILFGKRIRRMRNDRGWKQVDLGAHAELSRKHISELELGRTEVCLNAIERLAAALDTTPAELLRLPSKK